MIFPQKLDMHGRSDISDVCARVERHINNMQALIEANDSNLRKRIAVLEKADAAAAAVTNARIGDVLHALSTINARISALEDAVADLQENEP